MTLDTTHRFPTDWNVWRAQWSEWKAAYAAHLKPLPRWAWGLYPEQKNFMADEIMGRWLINEGTPGLDDGVVVELSEVTFPNLEDRDENGRLLHTTNRFVGLTFRTFGWTVAPENCLVSTFAELEQKLGIQ